MKHRWWLIAACLMPTAPVTADEHAAGAMATLRVGLTIPVRFGATLSEGRLCLRSNAREPYTTDVEGLRAQRASGRCVAAEDIHFEDQRPVTLWVIPE